MIVIAPSPARDFEKRRWDKFAELGDRLIEKYKTQLLFTSSEGEKQYVDEIIAKMNHTDAINISGRTSLLQLASLCRHFNLLITVNTFTMHFCVALNIPIVAIIGGTPAEVVANCDNPKFKYVENVDNINAITVDEVMEKVDELL